MVKEDLSMAGYASWDIKGKQELTMTVGEEGGEKSALEEAAAGSKALGTGRIWCLVELKETDCEWGERGIKEDR